MARFFGRAPRAFRALLLLPALGGVAPAQDGKVKGLVEDMNPRAPTTPLKVELTPYWCPVCIKDGTLPEPKPGEQHPIDMMNKPIETIVKQLELKDDWLIVETPHFKILSTLRGVTVKYDDSVFCKADLERLKTITPKITMGPDGAKLDAHQRVHMFQVRLEREYAHFAALTGCQLPFLGMPKRYEVFLWNDYTEHHIFCDRFIGGTQDRQGKQHHEMQKDQPDLMIFTTCESIVTQQGGKSDGNLANHVMHNVAHLMIDGYNGYYRETPAWLEEGLGHFYERREAPRWNNFCWAEGKPPTDFIKPDWETTIFSIVRRGKDPPFANWCERLQPGELNGVENGFTWGIVKWLIDTEPVRFTKMIEKMDDLKLNQTSAMMIQEAFGVSPSVLYQRWREYVLKNWAGS